jgi:diguanylate cyclase (GGDEF)-like protein/PAS domain S-box-containing protein
VPLENDCAQVVRWVMIVRDITTRKHAEETLRISQERYILAMQGANDGLWDWNLETNELHYSPRWKSMLGYQAAEIGNSSAEWLDRVHIHDRSRLDIAIDAHLKGASPHLMIEYRILHKDGTYRWMLCRGLAVRNGMERAYRMAGSQTDITDRKKAEEQLLYDAFHDNLTGIANRALFLDRLSRVIEHTKRRDHYQFAVLFLDLDRFKVINDSLGHIIGDQLLKLIAERLESVLRSGDTIARFGGDEFVILLEDIQSQQDAILVAERVQHKLEVPYLVYDQKVFTSASIGIVLSSIGYETTNEVVRDADIAMYQAKLMGKARYCVFTVQMREKAIARMELENDLHHALERGELFLDYQPYVSVSNQRIVGFEALLRWHHPRRGVIPPTEFIPIAEETGLIYRIGYWILKQACTQMARWHRRFPSDPPLKINVNISSKQFSRTRLWDDIREILEETGLDPGSLALEITENMLMENDDHVDDILAKLRAIGVKLQIDDFGTGYSSLGYLQRFPIHTLKIDPTFIHSLEVGGDQSNIVKTILSLAKELGMDTIAEGVETANQLTILRELHCPFVQGFLISRPVDHKQAYRLLESQNGQRSAVQIRQSMLADSAA